MVKPVVVISDTAITLDSVGPQFKSTHKIDTDIYGN